jgi:quercetin dioxygenase-like cupin family protein
MKSIALLTLLLMAASPQNLPDAYPREGVKQLIDNPRVTVWDVTLEKGKPTPRHQYRYDLVGVDLTDATVRVVNSDGRTETNVVKAGQVLSSKKGTTHIEESTTSDSSRHSIIVDLKDTKVSPLPNKSGYPLAFPRDGAKKVLETDRVIVWDCTWTPNKPTPMHFHDKDVVVVFMAEGQLNSTTPDRKTTPQQISYGLARFNARDRTHSEELVKGSARAIIFELK